MEIQTSRFGVLSVDDERVMTFPRGLLGFPSHTRFALIQTGQENYFFWLQSVDEPMPAEVSRRLGNGIAASESCVTAIYIAVRFLKNPFTEMQQFVIHVGGDVDTIGAMAGAVWGAANGASKLPPDGLARLEQRDRLELVVAELYDRRI